MKLSSRQVAGVRLLDISGRIVLGEASLLRDTVKVQLANGEKKFLLNLAEVQYIDSSGLGELISAYTTVRNNGGQLHLLKLTHKVRDLLQLTKLYTVFEVSNDEAQAIESLNKTSAKIGRASCRERV